MTVPPLAHRLVRKSERALRSARLDLQDGDSDGAINRACYAMFNVAQAALLSIGVSEEQLPKTHRGLIAAFGQHAVQSGRVDAGIGGVLGRTETLRLKADYTGTEIENWLRLRQQHLEPGTDAPGKPAAAPAADSRQRDIEAEPGLGLDRDLTEDD